MLHLCPVAESDTKQSDAFVDAAVRAQQVARPRGTAERLSLRDSHCHRDVTTLLRLEEDCRHTLVELISHEVEVVCKNLLNLNLKKKNVFSRYFHRSSLECFSTRTARNCCNTLGASFAFRSMLTSLSFSAKPVQDEPYRHTSASAWWKTNIFWLDNT